MSFQQGLSGLNGAAKSLDVIGNNIANASTVGFKGSQAQFADVYANSLNGAGGNQAGIGTKVANIAQQFTQGNIESSNNPLDIAINGAGFFRTESAGAVQYTRNGQFSLDKNGFIVNAQGAKLTGYGRFERPDPGRHAEAAADQHHRPEAGRHHQGRHRDEPRFARHGAGPRRRSTRRPDQLQQADPGRRLRHAGQRPHVLSTFYVKTGAGTWDVYAANDGTEVTNLKVAAGRPGRCRAGIGRARRLDRRHQGVPPVQADIARPLSPTPRPPAMVAAAAGRRRQRRAAQAAIKAAASTARRQVGHHAGPDRQGHRRRRQGAGRPGRHPEVRRQRRTVAAMMAPQTLPVTSTLPIFPPTGSKPTQLRSS
jgi:flagellar hook protein FlgE